MEETRVRSAIVVGTRLLAAGVTVCSAVVELLSVAAERGSTMGKFGRFDVEELDRFTAAVVARSVLWSGVERPSPVVTTLILAGVTGGRDSGVGGICGVGADCGELRGELVFCALCGGTVGAAGVIGPAGVVGTAGELSEPTLLLALFLRCVPPTDATDAANTRFLFFIGCVNCASSACSSIHSSYATASSSV